MYTEYQPCVALTPYIETYWASNTKFGRQQTIRILPDGCVDIIFNLIEDNNNGLKPFVPHLVGAMTVFSEVTYSRQMRMIGIRFRPCGITAFTRVPISEFTDSRVDTHLFKSLFADFDCDRLMELLTEREQVGYINSYLLTKLKELYSVNKQIVRVTDYIRATRGTIPIRELMDDVCLSQRQFERQFKNLTGVNPKMFSTIIRFTYTKAYIKQNRDKSLYTIALDCGFFDHAHLIRDFKRLGGTLPQR